MKYWSVVALGAEIVAIQRVSLAFEVEQGKSTLMIADTIADQLAHRDLF